jgi:hypothetical protein
MKDFLSAEQLHLTDAEYSALLLVEERFRTDPPPHILDTHVAGACSSPGSQTFFNMNAVEVSVELTDHSCGTAMCLLGWAQYLTQDYPFSRFMESPIGDLFFPEESSPAYQATPPQALKVLQNYLTTGQIDWNLIKEVAP